MFIISIAVVLIPLLVVVTNVLGGLEPHTPTATLLTKEIEEILAEIYQEGDHVLDYNGLAAAMGAEVIEKNITYELGTTGFYYINLPVGYTERKKVIREHFHKDSMNVLIGWAVVAVLDTNGTKTDNDGFKSPRSLLFTITENEKLNIVIKMYNLNKNGTENCIESPSNTGPDQKQAQFELKTSPLAMQQALEFGYYYKNVPTEKKDYIVQNGGSALRIAEIPGGKLENLAGKLDTLFKKSDSDNGKKTFYGIAFVGDGLIFVFADSPKHQDAQKSNCQEFSLPVTKSGTGKKLIRVQKKLSREVGQSAIAEDNEKEYNPMDATGSYETVTKFENNPQGATTAHDIAMAGVEDAPQGAAKSPEIAVAKLGDTPTTPQETPVPKLEDAPQGGLTSQETTLAKPYLGSSAPAQTNSQAKEKSQTSTQATPKKSTPSGSNSSGIAEGSVQDKIAHFNNAFKNDIAKEAEWTEEAKQAFPRLLTKNFPVIHIKYMKRGVAGTLAEQYKKIYPKSPVCNPIHNKRKVIATVFLEKVKDDTIELLITREFFGKTKESFNENIIGAVEFDVETRKKEDNALIAFVFLGQENKKK